MLDFRKIADYNENVNFNCRGAIMKGRVNEIQTLSPISVRDAFNQKDYDFSVDWLNVRLDCDNIDMLLCRLVEFLPELDIQDFKERPTGGVCFYTKGLHLPDVGYSSFVIAYNVDEYNRVINEKGGRGELYGVLLSISGDGCRFVNSLHEGAFIDLLKAISIFNPHCSRIDMACDIYDKDNCIVPMIQLFSDYAYDRDNAPVDFNCNLQRKPNWVTCNLVFDKNVCDFTRNVTIGGRDCKKGTLQLYNKRVEIEGRLQEYSDAILNAVGNPDYWWRLEYRCKSYADKVFQQLMQSHNIYAAFYEAVIGYGKFVQPTDDNVSRCLDMVEWLSFLLFIEKLADSSIHLVQFASLPYVRPTLAKIERFFNEQVAGTFAVNLLRCCLDKDYRRRQIYAALNNLYHNKRYVPALKELQQTYGLKLADFVSSKEWANDYFDI